MTKSCRQSLSPTMYTLPQSSALSTPSFPPYSPSLRISLPLYNPFLRVFHPTHPPSTVQFHPPVSPLSPTVHSIPPCVPSHCIIRPFCLPSHYTVHSSMCSLPPYSPSLCVCLSTIQLISPWQILEKLSDCDWYSDSTTDCKNSAVSIIQQSLTFYNTIPRNQWVAVTGKTITRGPVTAPPIFKSTIFSTPPPPLLLLHPLVTNV